MPSFRDKAFFFFFNDTATTEIYTLSLHDALPISEEQAVRLAREVGFPLVVRPSYVLGGRAMEIVFNEDDLRAYMRSEEHTSELQSLAYLVCRLLLEKKKKSTQALSEDEVMT